jgi:hypothetical protein
MAKHHKNETEQTPPRITHVHHEASQAAPIVARSIIIFAAVLLTWPAGVFLLDRAGVYRPDEVLAQIILWGLGLSFAAWLATHWLENFFDRWCEHREIMADKLTDQLHHKQLMLRSAVMDTRSMGEEARLSALVLAIMLEAYDHLARSKTRYFRGQSRPWSRRQAGAQVLASLGEREPVGEAMAQKAKAWLEEREVIIDEQVNLDRYPNLASIQRLLHVPTIIRTDYLPTPAQKTVEWSNIETH